MTDRRADPGPAAGTRSSRPAIRARTSSSRGWAAVKAVNGWSAHRSRPGGTRRRPRPDRRAGPRPPAATAAVGVRLRAARPGRRRAGPPRRSRRSRTRSARSLPRPRRARVAPADRPGDRARRPARPGRRAAPRPARPPAGGRRRPIQPNATRIIDLRADEAALWGDLRKKWRQYVNKARAGGITVVDAERRPPAASSTGSTARPRTGRASSSGPRAPTATSGRRSRPAGRARLLFAQTPDGEPLATLFLVRCGPRVVEPYGGMTAAGGESRANYLLKWEAIRSSRERRRDELRPVGPRDRRHRPLQDRVRRARGPLHRRVGPRPRSGRPAGLRARPARPRLVGAPPPRASRGGGSAAAYRAGRVSAPRARATRRAAPTGTRGPSTRPAATSTSRGPGPSTGAQSAGGRGSSSPTTAAAVLALTRPWPSIGGGSAYLPRGPVAGRPAVEPAALARAARSTSPRRWPATGSTSSPPTPRSPPRTPASRAAIAGRRLPARSRRSSRRATGSRCRSAPAPTRRPCSTGSPSRRASGSAAPSGTACRSSATTRRLGPDGAGEGFATPAEPPAAALDRFYDLLLETGERRQFSFGPRPAFVAWWRAALDAGHLVYLEARSRPARAGRRRRRPAGRPDPVPPRRPALDRPLGRSRRQPDASTRARSTCCAGGRSSWRSARAARRWISAASTSPAPATSRGRATRCTASTSTSGRSGAGGSS